MNSVFSSRLSAFVCIKSRNDESLFNKSVCLAFAISIESNLIKSRSQVITKHQRKHRKEISPYRSEHMDKKRCKLN